MSFCMSYLWNFQFHFPGTIRLGLYYSLKSGWEKRHTGEKMPLPQLIVLGATAGIVGSFVSTFYLFFSLFFMEDSRFQISLLYITLQMA